MKLLRQTIKRSKRVSTRQITKDKNPMINEQSLENYESDSETQISIYYLLL